MRKTELENSTRVELEGDCTGCIDYLIEKKRVREEDAMSVTALDGLLLTFSLVRNLKSIYRCRGVFKELDSLIQDPKLKISSIKYDFIEGNTCLTITK